MAEGGAGAAAADQRDAQAGGEWKIIGKPTKRLDSPEKVTGKAEFGMDVQIPGLMTALVARPPVFGAKVKSFDAGEGEGGPRGESRRAGAERRRRASRSISGRPSGAATR